MYVYMYVYIYIHLIFVSKIVSIHKTMSKLYMEANFNLTFWTSNIILKNVPRLSLTEWEQ